MLEYLDLNDKNVKFKMLFLLVQLSSIAVGFLNWNLVYLMT